jgi:hypothetical protein
MATPAHHLAGQRHQNTLLETAHYTHRIFAAGHLVAGPYVDVDVREAGSNRLECRSRGGPVEFESPRTTRVSAGVRLHITLVSQIWR